MTRHTPLHHAQGKQWPDDRPIPHPITEKSIVDSLVEADDGVLHRHGRHIEGLLLHHAHVHGLGRVLEVAAGPCRWIACVMYGICGLVGPVSQSASQSGDDKRRTMAAGRPAARTDRPTDTTEGQTHAGTHPWRRPRRRSWPRSPPRCPPRTGTPPMYRGFVCGFVLGCWYVMVCLSVGGASVPLGRTDPRTGVVGPCASNQQSTDPKEKHTHTHTHPHSHALIATDCRPPFCL